MNLVRESNCGIVVRHHTRAIAISARECDAVVYVENGSLASASRPYVSLAWYNILFGVHLAIGPHATALDGRLGRGCIRGVVAKVVSREECACNTGVEFSVAVIHAVNDGETEAARVP